jgi:biopolymer transport protein ExbD
LTDAPARRREPTIALINVVFLLLIFFLIAGTLAAPLDPRLTLVRAEGLTGVPPDGVVILADGTLLQNGAPVTLDDVAEGTVRILPDRDLPAAELVRIGRALAAAGADHVLILAEQALP